MPEIRDSQWEHGKLMFAGDVQHGTARHEYLEIGAGPKQVDQQWRGFQYLLEVVQQQQVCFLTYSGFQLLDQWLLSRSW